MKKRGFPLAGNAGQAVRPASGFSGVRILSGRLSLSKKSFMIIFLVLLHAGLASQALRKLFAGRTAWPAFRAKHETTIF